MTHSSSSLRSIYNNNLGTQKIDTRARARSISLKIDNTSTSQFWKVGHLELIINQDGKKIMAGIKGFNKCKKCKLH